MSVGRLYLLRGAPVVLLARWNGPGPRNVLLLDTDGRRIVRPFRGLRRLRLADTRGASA